MSVIPLLSYSGNLFWIVQLTTGNDTFPVPLQIIKKQNQKFTTNTTGEHLRPEKIK